MTLTVGLTGQYQGRTTMMAHTNDTTLALQEGGGTMMSVPLVVFFAGVAAVPAVVFLRMSVTPPPVSAPLVQSTRGAAQTACAGEAGVSGESCTAVTTETMATTAQTKEATRNRRGRSGVRVAAMTEKIRAGSEGASGIVHNR
jgi:hypothetical protein